MREDGEALSSSPPPPLQVAERKQGPRGSPPCSPRARTAPGSTGPDWPDPPAGGTDDPSWTLGQGGRVGRAGPSYLEAQRDVSLPIHARPCVLASARKVGFGVAHAAPAAPLPGPAHRPDRCGVLTHGNTRRNRAADRPPPRRGRPPKMDTLQTRRPARATTVARECPPQPRATAGSPRPAPAPIPFTHRPGPGRPAPGGRQWRGTCNAW